MCVEGEVRRWKMWVCVGFIGGILGSVWVCGVWRRRLGLGSQGVCVYVVHVDVGVCDVCECVCRGIHLPVPYCEESH